MFHHSSEKGYPMRSTFVPITLVTGSLIFITGVCSAALLGVLPGFPAISYDGAGSSTTYTNSTKSFAVNATPLAMKFTPTGPLRFIQPVNNMQVLTLRVIVDSSGTLLGGIPTEDLIVIGAVDQDGDGIIDYS